MEEFTLTYYKDEEDANSFAEPLGVVVLTARTTVTVSSMMMPSTSLFSGKMPVSVSTLIITAPHLLQDDDNDGELFAYVAPHHSKRLLPFKHTSHHPLVFL
jgi:hypothetical protein